MAASKKTDTTLVVLREIRDELKKTNLRVDGLAERIDGTNDRIDGLARHVTEMEIRLATAIAELVGTVRETRDGRMREVERRVTELERKRG